MIRTVLLVVFIFQGLLCGPSVFAHDSRPLFINITESSEHTVMVTWKTPPSVNLNNAPNITLVFISLWAVSRLNRSLLLAFDNRPLRLGFSYALGILSAVWFIDRFTLAFV